MNGNSANGMNGTNGANGMKGTRDFLSPEARSLAPYVPGEQPQDQQYVKLNTNESPFPPSPKVCQALTRAEIGKLDLYPDPDASALRAAIAERYDLRPENVVAGNGSDEILAFAFRAFCGTGRPVAYADITYGFYRSQTALFGLDAKVVPLREDLTLDASAFKGFPGMVVLADPNAPTGIALPRSDIQRLLEEDPDRVILVDEAYVDFGGESCVPLLYRFDNLLVVQTFSKSRSLAGMRIGYALGSPALIEGLNRVKYSFHPYTVDRLAALAGAAAMEDEAYFQKCTAAIRENRAATVRGLDALGFTTLPSSANFVFTRHPSIGGGDLYRRLKEEGVLVRWFDEERLRDWIRVSIGSADQMETFLDAAGRILDAL